MAVPQQVTERDRAITLLTAFFDSFVPRADWRHTEVADIVDALIEAARAPESAHSRAVDEEGRRVGRLEGRPIEFRAPGD